VSTFKTRAKDKPGPESDEEREARTTLKNQIDALEKAGCERIYKDIASGGKYDRSELNKAIESLGPGDVLLFYRTDRLSRSLGDLMKIWNRIGERGAKFKSLTEGELDATSAMGDAMMKIIGVFAELERKMIIERTNTGLRRVWKEGKESGPRFTFSPVLEKQIANEVLEQGKTQAETAAKYRVHPSTLCRIVARAKGRQASREARRQARFRGEPLFRKQ
jgi:DNA invertase Pin-like site-specific DNA recombinase